MGALALLLHHYPVRQFSIIFTIISIVSWGNYDLGVTEYKKRNFSRAFIEFKKASREDDHVRAQTALALMYKYGEGTKTDLTLAYQWNLKAAKLGIRRHSIMLEQCF